MAIAVVLLSLSVRRRILIDDISLQGDAVIVSARYRHLLVQSPLCVGVGSIPVAVTGVPAGTRDQLQSVQDAGHGKFRVKKLDKMSLELLRTP